MPPAAPPRPAFRADTRRQTGGKTAKARANNIADGQRTRPARLPSCYFSRTGNSCEIVGALHRQCRPAYCCNRRHLLACRARRP
jgi:hypothetical protein